MALEHSNLVLLFQAFDHQQKGYLTWQDWQELCNNVDLKDNECGHIFSLLDKDGDQKIGLDDFVNGFREAQEQDHSFFGSEVTREKELTSVSTAPHSSDKLSAHKCLDRSLQTLQLMCLSVENVNGATDRGHLPADKSSPLTKEDRKGCLQGTSFWTEKGFITEEHHENNPNAPLQTYNLESLPQERCVANNLPVEVICPGSALP